MSDIRNAAHPISPYVLGHSDREIERLKTQARLIDPITERFFREAGIIPGMRVLDVGTGAGDVAFLAATIVGDKGEVVGVDRVPAALEAARARAAALAPRNVVFREGDPGEMAFERPFDAVIGRYVLQFQRDPATMLRAIARHARPGGLITFHEIDWAGLGSFSPAPTCWRNTGPSWCGPTRRKRSSAERRAAKSTCARRRNFSIIWTDVTRP